MKENLPLRQTAPLTTPSWQGSGRHLSVYYFFAALMFGIVSMFAAWFALSRAAEEMRLQSRPVVVAAQDIPQGIVITPEWVRVVPVNVTPSDALTDLDQAVNKWAKYPIGRGEVLSEGKVLAIEPGTGKPGAPSSIHLKIPREPSGLYAFNLPVNWLQSPPPAPLVPGVRLDIFAYPPGTLITEAKIILSKVEILDLVLDSQGNIVFLILTVNWEQARLLSFARGNQMQLGLLVNPPGSIP